MITYQDKKCVCRDCEQEFTFSAHQQEQFSTRGFNPPTRCTKCHAKRTGRRAYSRGGSCRMHTAPCSVCGKEADLPFKPSADKPVYCEVCFKAQNAKRKPAPASPVATPNRADAPDMGDSFARFGLDQRLQRAIAEAGYGEPTPVQAAAIPIGLSGRDYIGTAQTGTGKTAAFVLPILQHLLANPAKKPCTRAIVLTPTRELAEQIHETFCQLGKFTDIRSATVYGGVAMSRQEKALRTGFDVIVACPGRLLDHMDRGNTDFSGVTKLVLDEADRMLDMGFLPPIKNILSRLPVERQSMLLSATFAPELMQLTKDALKDPLRVDVDLQTPPKTIAHALYPCPQHLKTSLVFSLLEKTDVNSVLIFTRTKHRASRVARQIESAGYSTASLHADRTQNQRQSALDRFRSGECQILVATDIAARGLDVATISHVINYDVPATADTYIHRIGRTGRMEREGDAMTLVTPLDAAVVFEIEKALGGPIERRKLEDFDYSVPEPPRQSPARGSAPRRPVSNAATAVKACLTKAKPKQPKPQSYFAKQRTARAKASGGY